MADMERFYETVRLSGPLRSISKQDAQESITTISNLGKIGSLVDFVSELEMRKSGVGLRDEWFLKVLEMSADQKRLLALASLEQQLKKSGNSQASCLCGHTISTDQQIEALRSNEDYAPAKDMGKVIDIVDTVMGLVRFEQELAEGGRIKIEDL